MDKKSIIKKLTLENFDGTESLYQVIPFYMRTRLDSLIDAFDWEELKQSCENNEHNSLLKASEIYSEVMKSMNKYIDEGRKKSQQAENDNLMLMRTDLNFIKLTFGSDAVKFVKAMAECIEKEDELLAMYQYKDVFRPILSPENFNNENLYSNLQLSVIENIVDDVPAQEGIMVDEGLDDVKKHFACLANLVMAFNSDLNGFSESLLEVDSLMTNSSHPIFDELEALIKAMVEYQNTLALKVMEWRKDEAKFSVGVGPVVSLDPLRKCAAEFGSLIKELYSFLHNNDSIQKIREIGTVKLAQILSSFQNLVQAFLRSNLVVSQQPKDLMSIESVGSRRNKEGEAAAVTPADTKKQNCKKFSTKKKNNFDTEVELLGGQCLIGIIRFATCSAKLVAEKENGLNETICNLTYSVTTKEDEDIWNITFEKVSINSFSRVEQNHIYKQFFRLKYRVTVDFGGTSIELTVLSLPFMFNTGSNQILELIAARMWYCANFDLYNGTFFCDDSLRVADIIQMLNNRVTHLDPKGLRCLYEDEIKFLTSRLPNNSNGRITMQSFIKDKMKKTRLNEDLSFSFHTWFYAVLNALKEKVLQPWLEGYIYGFCCEIESNELLKNEKVGTFVLRPALSRELSSMSSREACADLTMDVKMESESSDGTKSSWFIQSIPVCMKAIDKYTLHGYISGIKKGNESIAKYCLTRQGRKSIYHLRKFSPAGKGEDQFKDYNLSMRKFQQMNISTLKKSDDASNDKADVEEEAPQRKRQHFCMSSSASIAGPSAASQQFPLTNNHVLVSDVDIQVLQPYDFSDDITGGQRSDHQSNSVPVGLIEPEFVPQVNLKGKPEPSKYFNSLDLSYANNNVLGTPISDEDLATIINCIDNDGGKEVWTMLSDSQETIEPNSHNNNHHLPMVNNGQTTVILNLLQSHLVRMDSNPPSNISCGTNFSSPSWAQEELSSSYSQYDSGIDQDHIPLSPDDQ